MESTDNVGDSEKIGSKGTNNVSAFIPNEGHLSPQNAPQGVKRCPECGSDCLDVHVDSKGEIFYSCLRCYDIWPKESDVS